MSPGTAAGRPGGGRIAHAGARLWGQARQRLLFEVGLAFITLGAVVLLFVGYELVGTNIAEQHSQARLARQFEQAVAAAAARAAPAATAGAHGVLKPGAAKPAAHPATRRTAGDVHAHAAGASHGASAGPAGAGGATGASVVPLPLPPPGGALDHLVIPAIGVDRYVVQGVDEADLQEGPGHYPGTPLPGERGNVGIAGHRTTYGAPFFRLNELSPGDLVYLTDTSGTTWVYAVEHLSVVSPDDVAVLDPSHGAELTLTTCNPRFEATSRLVARAFLAAELQRGTKLTGRLPVALPGPGKSNALPGKVGETAKELTKPEKEVAPGQGHKGSATAGKGEAGHPGAQTPVAGRGKTAQPQGGSDNPTVGPAGGTGAAGQPGPGQGGSRQGSQASGAGSLAGALGAAGGWTWFELAGWALLALALWVVTRVRAAQRHGYTKVVVLCAGALVCLVPLWFAFENAVVLLPANF